jgi:hypothetical protein
MNKYCFSEEGKMPLSEELECGKFRIHTRVRIRPDFVFPTLPSVGMQVQYFLTLIEISIENYMVTYCSTIIDFIVMQIFTYK